jgi:hypothetical protein
MAGLLQMVDWQHRRFTSLLQSFIAKTVSLHVMLFLLIKDLQSFLLLTQH